MKIKELETLI